MTPALVWWQVNVGDMFVKLPERTMQTVIKSDQVRAAPPASRSPGGHSVLASVGCVYPNQARRTIVAFVYVMQ
jgi:hypothetical protein